MKNPLSYLPTTYSEKPTVDQITEQNTERLSPWILPKNDLTFYHYHDFIEIGYCFQGSGIHYDNDAKFTYENGDALFVIPGRAHYTISAPAVESKWMFLYFDYKRMTKNLFGTPDLSQEGPLNPETTLYGIISRRKFPTICDQVLRITEQYRTFLPHRNELLCVQFLELIFLLNREDGGNTPCCVYPVKEFGRFKKTIHYINDAIENGRMPTVEELAKVSFLSLSYFRKEFTRVVGVAPYDYIIRAAILRAQKLLMTTDRSILKICSDVGFKSISSLNRNFQLQCGMSPKEYRRMHQTMY